MASSATTYCVDLIRQYDRDRYITTLFAPGAVRPALQAVYAFNLEVARTREAVSEPMLGEIRLQWWREAIDEAFAGSPRKHEVVTALSNAVAQRPELQRYFDAIIDARAADLYDRRFRDIDDLERYAEGTSTNVILLALAVLGVAMSSEIEVAASHTGKAYAYAGLLRAVWFHARHGRVFLPDGLLARHHLAPRDVLSGRHRERLHPAFDELADRATQHLTAARSGLPRPPVSAVPALLPATLADTYLAQLRRTRYAPSQEPAPGPGPIDILRLWSKAWRRRF